MTEHARKHAYATASEVADYMRISRKSFARHVAPTLVGIEVGSRTIYEWEEVDGWLERHRAGASTAQSTGRTTSASGSRGSASRSQREKDLAERLKSRLHGSTPSTRAKVVNLSREDS